MLDQRKDVCSLKRLLEEIRRQCRILSREQFVTRYVDSFPSAQRERAGEAATLFFTKQAETKGSHIAKRLVASDLERLESVWKDEGIAAVANQRVAHFVPDKPLPLPRWRHVHDAIATIGQITKRYDALLRAKDGALMPWQTELDRDIREFWK